ncbi:MAG: hypothetical protein ABI921_11310 [Panacibacter sp.]
MNVVMQNQDTNTWFTHMDENGEVNLLLKELNITMEGLETDYANYAHLFFGLS